MSEARILLFMALFLSFTLYVGGLGSIPLLKNTSNEEIRFNESENISIDPLSVTSYYGRMILLGTPYSWFMLIILLPQLAVVAYILVKLIPFVG
jgi:hypothetical protein